MELKGICIADKIFGGKFIRDGESVIFMDYNKISKEEGRVLDNLKGDTFDPNIYEFIKYAESMKKASEVKTQTTNIGSRTDSKKSSIRPRSRSPYPSNDIRSRVDRR